jgi:hypothetical protein
MKHNLNKSNIEANRDIENMSPDKVWELWKSLKKRSNKKWKFPKLAS